MFGNSDAEFTGDKVDLRRGPWAGNQVKTLSMLKFVEEDDTCRGRHWGLPGRVVSAAVVGVLLAWSLVLAFSTVQPCPVSRDWDVMRDVSIAQSILDGRYPEDPVLRGEISWYNPLTGLVLLALHYVTGMPLMRLSVVAGPFLNLLAPAGFYVLAAALFGRAAALAGLCLVLFGKEGALPLWTCAYSPWLLASVYSLGLLFLTLAAFVKALRGGSTGLFCLTGLMLGIAFLGHTAPAIIAGGVMLLLTLWECGRLRFVERQSGDAGRLLFRFLAVLVVAFFVSLPYTGPILWRYQFQVLNPWPSLYASQNMELQNLAARIQEAVSLRNGLALFGAVMLLRWRRRLEVKLMACWVVVVGALVVQHYVWQALRLNGVVLPALVPGHHAGIHLSAVRTVLFGVGVASLGELGGMAAARLLRRMTGKPARDRVWRLAGAAAAVVCCGAGLYWSNPYGERVDFKPPAGTAYHDLYVRYLPMYEWIRENIPPEAVFLCPKENLGIQVVMPAARKLVNPMLLYSNPYVDRGKLTLRQDAILKALVNGDGKSLCDEAGSYPGLFLLLEEPVDKKPPFSTELHGAGGTVLYEVHPCWQAATD